LLRIVNFRRYRAFYNVAIRKLKSLLRNTIIGAKTVCFLKMLVNEQSLTTIKERMPAVELKALGYG
jgi:hypothetical protein